MRITRKGTKEASGAIMTAVAGGVFFAAVYRGVPVGTSLGTALACAIPFLFVESLFDLPQIVRHARANWRFHLGLMAIMVVPIAAWRVYALATGMTKEERIHSALLLAGVMPVLALISIVFAHRKGMLRPVSDE